jgi:ABC-type bacteriocin/lantibiotic exporter with double-glycine peptidase domain
VSIIAGVDIFVKDMKNNYETIIGENASSISQGQKQRISLARALIKKPKILLLDEAFSGLPENDEAQIVETIRAKFKGITIISATHRLASLPKNQVIIKL